MSNGGLLLLWSLLSLSGCSKPETDIQHANRASGQIASDQTSVSAESPRVPQVEEQVDERYANADLPEEEKQDSQVANSKEIVEFSAIELKNQFNANGEAFLSQYSGKQLRVVGKVIDIGTAAGGIGLLQLEAYLPGEPYKTIAAYTRSKQPWNEVLPDQNATVVGTLPENASTLELVECDILSVTGGAPPETDAEALASEIREDEDLVNKKYFNKHLILRGHVESIIEDEFKNTKYLLKNSAGIEIRCAFQPFNAPTSLAVGQKIKVLGEYSGASNGSVSIVLAILLDE